MKLVSRETNCQRSGYLSSRKQGFQPHTNYHTSGERKQAKCLANSEKTVQGETRVCSRPRPLARSRSQASKGRKASPLEPD